MRILWLIGVFTIISLVSGVKIEEISKAEDDGTMTSLTIVAPGVYRAVAPNHDSYVRFTMPTGCYNLHQFSYVKMKVWANAGVQFTIEMRQGFDDCRLDLWPYVKDSAATLISHYTAKRTFDGSGQDVWIPITHFNVDHSKTAQIFISSIVTIGSGAATTVQFGNIEFTNDAPTISIPPAMPQNPTTWNCEKPYTLAITFDNQHSGNLNQILDVLKAHNAKCTVFQIGGELVEDDVAMKRLISEGHQVAAHTWTHPDLLELTEEQIRREMTLTDQAIQTRLGAKTKWFRPPFGHQDPRVRGILNDMGYISVIWNIDSTDYFNQENGPMVWSRIQARLDQMDPSRVGGLLLLHNDIKASADLVEKVITYAQGKGFKEFVTMEQCMAGKFNSFLGQPPAAPPALTTMATPVAIGPVQDNGDKSNPIAVAPNPSSADKTQTSGAGFSASSWVAACTVVCMVMARYVMM